MAYVDLNPIRAKMAKTPERSTYTSIKRRIEKAQTSDYPNQTKQQVKALLPLVGNPRQKMPKGLPFRLVDYLQLVEQTGRIIREDKRGFIDASLPPLLERLALSPEQWLKLCTNFESNTSRFAGSIERIKAVASHFKVRRIHQREQNYLLFG